MTRLEALETLQNFAAFAKVYEENSSSVDFFPLNSENPLSPFASIKRDPPAKFIFLQCSYRDEATGTTTEINITSEMLYEWVAALEESLINHPEKP